MNGIEVDLAAVNGKVTAESASSSASASDCGVEHGARLVSFTEAVMGSDDGLLDRERKALRALLPPESFVDVAATIGAFNVVDRIADATGIPLDDMMKAMSADVRQELNLARFSSSANTPGVD